MTGDPPIVDTSLLDLWFISYVVFFWTMVQSTYLCMHVCVGDSSCLDDGSNSFNHMYGCNHITLHVNVIYFLVCEVHGVLIKSICFHTSSYLVLYRYVVPRTNFSSGTDPLYCVTFKLCNYLTNEQS